eukprot:SAG31_NODE_433_length_15750_cov_6.132579_2_plen_82_part_00
MKASTVMIDCVVIVRSRVYPDAEHIIGSQSPKTDQADVIIIVSKVAVQCAQARLPALLAIGEHCSGKPARVCVIKSNVGSR